MLRQVRSGLVLLAAVAVAGGLLIWFVRPPAAEVTTTYTGEPSARGKLPAPAYTGPKREPASVPPGFAPVAEDGFLRLYFHEKEYKLIVADLRTGYLWHSTPADAAKAKSNALFKDLLNSLVRVKYQVGTKNQSDVTGLTAAKKSFTRVDGGVRVKVDFEKVGIGFDLEVTLRDGGLEIAVPWESVRERATGRGIKEGNLKDAARLLAITPVPFFGAAPNGTDGYIVLPDGSGSISYFRERPHAELIFAEPVYGADPTFLIDHRLGRFEPVHLPLIGVVRDGHAVAAFMTEGDTDAWVEAAASGQAVAYNRVMAEFLYRKTFQVAFSRSRRAIVPEENLIPGDRRQRFVFLTGEQANYVGVGHAYRDYLVAARAIKPAAKAPAPVMVRLFGGVNRKGALWDQYVPMTRFDQAQQILSALKGGGIESMAVVLEAWQQEGYAGEIPDRFPPARQLGGEKGLRSLIDWARAQKLDVYLEDDYLNAFDTRASGFSPRTEAVRNAQGLIRPVNRYDLALGRAQGAAWYLVNPLVALQRQIPPALAQFKEWGVSGVEMTGAGDTLVSAYRTSPLTRAGHAAVWQKALRGGREALGASGVRGANAYAIGAADYIWGVPLDHSHHWLEDEPVPLYQVVLHGLVPYYAQPGNLRDDRQTEFLRMVEYGALPSFVLTAENPAELRDSVVRHLYSGIYQEWLEEVAGEAKVAAEALLPVASQRIVGHSRPVPQVAQTLYEDGTRIVVNYSGHYFDLPGQRVAPRSFAVIKGGGR